MNRDERMHLTLKKEATKPPALDFLQQQARFDEFIDPSITNALTFTTKLLSLPMPTHLLGAQEN
jgi:hypothetical protein